jgi:hypothetical protein
MIELMFGFWGEMDFGDDDRPCKKMNCNSGVDSGTRNPLEIPLPETAHIPSSKLTI